MKSMSNEKNVGIVEYVKAIFKDRKFKYISFFWIVMAIQFVIGSNLQVRKKSLINVGGGLLKIIYLSILFIIIHYCFLELYKKIKKKRLKENIENNVEEENVKLEKYKMFIYFAIIILCWIPTLLAFYPCIVSYDGGYQIRDYIFEGKINLGHPIITTILYSSFYSFGVSYLNSPTVGMLIFSIFQMTLMAFIFSYAVKFIEKETGKKYLRNISILIYGLFPYNQLFSMMTTKDVLFAGFTLLFIINLYKMLKYKYEIQDYIAFIGITVIMLSLRVNALYAFLVLIPISIFILIKNKKQLKKFVVMIVISIIMYQCFNNLILNIVNEKSEGNDIWMCTFSQAAAKIANEKNDKLSDFEKEKISYFFGSNEELGKKYIQYIADSTMRLAKRDEINKDKKDFLEFMILLMKKYPREFIDSYLNTMRGYWYVLDDSFCRIRTKSYKDKMGALELYCFPVGQEEYKIQEDSKIPMLKQWYINMFCKNQFLKIPVLRILFQPATYFYILVAYVLYALYKKFKVRLLIGMYLFLYFITCFTAPCAIIRYIYAIIVSVPVIFGFVVKNNEKK